MQISEKQNILTRTWVVAALACVCCILWGSAIPVIKTGYRILAVDSADTASQIVFAGIRFALAGILVLLFASFREKRVVLPDGKIFKYVIPVCFAQTFVQYFFFYIGVAHTSGVKGGIITGLGNFIAILMACLLVRNEKMTGRKLAGCILGFAGVVIINMAGGSMDMGFRLTGEGFVLIAQLSYGASTVLINIFSKKVSPVILSGCQFFMGGVLLFIVGILMGGHLDHMSIAGVVLILYLAMVSAVAYTLWSVLLAHNEVSKVAIFGFVNPLCSVVLSALVLGEVSQAFNARSLIALILVCVGIYIVNCKRKKFGVDIIYYDDIEDGVEILSKYVEKDKTMGIDKTWPSKFLIRLQELGGGSKFVNGSPIIDYIRMVKDEKEQDLMRKSSKINDIAMDKIIPWVAKGLTEKELNAKMREIYKELGCEDVSFDPITAYGHGAADPHHVTDDSKGKRGDCVILDIGGFKDNYASDMTRTVFIGEVSDRAREVYNVVLEANLRGIAAAKPGNRMCDVDLAARNYIEEKGFGEYFTHRTGHSIGLEDHEFGDVSSVNTDIIKVGQCFSVEPGIYLPDENIGVRIEDLVLITEDGCEVLNDYTKELIVVPEE